MPDESVFQDEAPIVSEAEKAGLTREQAIEFGRKLGADEVDRRGDTGARKQERIERAAAYAAWDYDGRPAKGQPKYVKPERLRAVRSERDDPTRQPAADASRSDEEA